MRTDLQRQGSELICEAVATRSGEMTRNAEAKRDEAMRSEVSQRQCSVMKREVMQRRRRAGIRIAKAWPSFEWMSKGIE